VVVAALWIGNASSGVVVTRNAFVVGTSSVKKRAEPMPQARIRKFAFSTDSFRFHCSNFGLAVHSFRFLEVVAGVKMSKERREQLLAKDQ